MPVVDLRLADHLRDGAAAARGVGELVGFAFASAMYSFTELAGTEGAPPSRGGSR